MPVGRSYKMIGMREDESLSGFRVATPWKLESQNADDMITLFLGTVYALGIGRTRRRRDGVVLSGERTIWAWLDVTIDLREVTLSGM